MNILTLNGGLLLHIETGDKKLRLVISNGTTEMACRKVTPAILLQFLSSTNQNLFKGRLQLFKDTDAVNIVLKGTPVGIIPIPVFKNALHTL